MKGRTISVVLLYVGLAGCASVNLSAGFPDVRATVEERSAAKIAWNSDTEPDREAAERLHALLSRRLTAEDAIQIALLNNRSLQVIYADLGLAQADLVQAGLFRNPVLDAAVMFPLSGARPDLQFGAVVSLLDVLYVPLRKRVAATFFEAAKLRVSGAVLDFAGEVRAAFYDHQANEQLLELRQAVAQALGLSFEASRRLHQAGNISDLDLARERIVAERAKVALRSAETAARQSRERLTALMGVWGQQTAWEIDGRLPGVPGEPPSLPDIERDALARSLELAHARQLIVTAGERVGYERATSLVPSTSLGLEAEREDGWKLGPAVAVPLPLFDQGQGRIGRGVAELRRADQEYYALGVRIRSAARALRDRLLGAHDRARYYEEILLPLHERVVNEAQLQYNAMQVGIVQLLRDREQQIEAGAAYVETLRDYWLARTDLAQIMGGRMPVSARARAAAASGRASIPREDANGH